MWTVTCGIVNTSSASIIFTPAANWTVVSTTSVSTLTIKDYPFGNEMQNISLVVGLNLAILAGSPVTIADPTGLNTMTGYVTSYAPNTGVLVCQIGCSFDLEIREHHHHGHGYGETEWSGEGVGGPIITAQLGNGIFVVGLGIVLIRIAASEIVKLHHKTYGIGMTMYDGADTRQLFIGKMPILSGGVSSMPFVQPLTSNPYGLP